MCSESSERQQDFSALYFTVDANRVRVYTQEHPALVNPDNPKVRAFSILSLFEWHFFAAQARGEEEQDGKAEAAEV